MRTIYAHLRESRAHTGVAAEWAKLIAEQRERVEVFLELIDEILNAVLFVMIGLELLRVEFDARYLWEAAGAQHHGPAHRVLRVGRHDPRVLN